MKVRLMVLAAFALALAVESTSNVAQEQDGQEQMPESDWKAFCAAVQSHETYASFHALRQEVMEPKLDAWKTEWGIHLRASWKSYLQENQYFESMQGETLMKWRITHLYRKAEPTDDWVVEVYEDAEGKRSNKRSWHVAADQMAKLNFQYLERVRQTSPLDEPAPQVNHLNQSPAFVLRDLLSPFDADYALPESGNSVTLKLRHRTYREVVQLVGQTAGWLLEVEDRYKQKAVYVDAEYLADQLRSESESKPELNLADAIPAAIHEELEQTKVPSEPGNIFVRATLK
ncbi:MAG: hypothetical protein H6841_08850 [Planctomycetes bacterium]|nr:hypothetical protein [Planctomycetota bacterium]MCB9936137.1 hypothetical protein [Planctomycetota bacterium]